MNIAERWYQTAYLTIMALAGKPVFLTLRMESLIRYRAHDLIVTYGVTPLVSQVIEYDMQQVEVYFMWIGEGPDVLHFYNHRTVRVLEHLSQNGCIGEGTVRAYH